MSFHALVVLLLVLVATSGALTQSIYDTGDFDALLSYAPASRLIRICVAPSIATCVGGGAQANGRACNQYTRHQLTWGDRLLACARLADGKGGNVQFLDQQFLRRMDALKRNFLRMDNLWPSVSEVTVARPVVYFATALGIAEHRARPTPP